MSVVTLSSEDARMQWRRTIDAAYAQKQAVVIERYGQPIVTILNHSLWQATLKRLKVLEALHTHKERMKETEDNPSLDVSQEEFLHILAKEGLRQS